MPLLVDIKKNLDRFRLRVAFETGDEILALLGASGCGKSMTLKCIAGIVTPDAGKIILNGRTLFDSDKKINLTPQKRRVGYLFQQFALFPNMTVEQNIETGFRRPGKPARRAAAAEMLRAMRLEGLEKKMPSQLSGGQQQRVALARILVGEPELLLLDEPFSSLDSYLKWQLELGLMETLSNFSGPSVFVSHDRNEVYRLCDNVCVLADGSSEPMVPVKRLFNSPSTLSACLVSGCKNFSRARSAGDGELIALDWGDAALRVPGGVPGGVTHIGVRAHYIHIADGPGENTIKCSVASVIDDVFSTILMLDTPGERTDYSFLRIELPKGELSGLRANDELYVYIAPEDIMLLGDSHHRQF